jgi:hypothetical protein
LNNPISLSESVRICDASVTSGTRLLRGHLPPNRTPTELLTEVQSLDNCAVALDINLFEVLQQLAAFTYQAEQGTLSTEVLAVRFEVLCKVADTVGKQRDLALRRTGVGVRLSVLTEKLLLFSADK